MVTHWAGTAAPRKVERRRGSRGRQLLHHFQELSEMPEPQGDLTPANPPPGTHTAGHPARPVTQVLPLSDGEGLGSVGSRASTAHLHTFLTHRAPCSFPLLQTALLHTHACACMHTMHTHIHSLQAHMYTQGHTHMHTSSWSPPPPMQ